MSRAHESPFAGIFPIPELAVPWQSRHVDRLFWVCFGSALGGGARYLAAQWVSERLGPSLAYGTLAVNTLGSFLIGVVMYAGTEAAAISPMLRLALTTGVLGGFTTYSTFSYETLRYLQEGNWATALVNIVVTVLGCLLLTFLGWTLARWLFGA